MRAGNFMKTRELIWNFIEDNAEFILVYFLNTAILLTFFYLLYQHVEIAYPVCLSVFIFLIWIIIKWIKYKAFNIDIYMSKTNIDYKIRCFSKEQKRVAAVIKKLNFTYGMQISSIKIKDKEHRRLVSQFIHSLKAPVTVIDMAVSNLSAADNKCNENNEIAHNLTYINTEDESLSDIKIENEKILSTLDNLLSLLRLEEFELDYAAEAVNLEENLKKIINSMKRNFIYGRVIPKVQCNCKQPIVYTDEKWNKIMLEQFISNAIKYSYAGNTSTEEGMKSLLFTIDKADGHVILSIKDQGIGIPEYDLDRITEPFFTGENGRMVKNSSGIGLYITKRISEKLNHKVQIKSTPNIGTEIEISYLSKL